MLLDPNNAVLHSCFSFLKQSLLALRRMRIRVPCAGTRIQVATYIRDALRILNPDRTQDHLPIDNRNYEPV